MDEFFLSLFVIIGSILALYPLRKHRKLCFILLPLMLISIGIIYWYCGSWSLWEKYKYNLVQQKNVRQLLSTENGFDKIILRLQNHLRQHDNDARGWFLLGKLFMSQAKWSDASLALERAHLLNPQDEKITLNAAQSFAMLNNQRLNLKYRKLLDTILQHNPSQPDALMLLAMDAYQRHHYQEAIDKWQELLKILPNESPEAKELRAAIAQAFSQVSSK